MAWRTMSSMRASYADRRVPRRAGNSRGDRPALTNFHFDSCWRRSMARQGLVRGVWAAEGVDSENGPQRGQFLPDSQAHSHAMGQEAGEKWTAAAHLQPT
ncbi:MAG TPA: hypothetical protein PKE22_00590, partial [Ottowia sp.]|nr:hypothetical protein [Ottowia sp.]